MYKHEIKKINKITELLCNMKKVLFIKDDWKKEVLSNKIDKRDYISLILYIYKPNLFT